MKTSNTLPKSSLPPLLSLTYLLQHQADELLAKEVKVGLSQVRIMSALSASPVSQRAVAMALRQTEANVSRQLQAMKKLGLVSVTKNKKDARARDVKLTAKGKNRYSRAHETLRKMERSLATKEASALKLAAETLISSL